MRILGIDPGVERTGWGVIVASGRDFAAKDYGLIVTAKDLDFPTRLLAIYNGVMELLTKHTPDIVGVEELFFAKNAKSALAVGHARGVCILAAASKGIPLEEVTPLQVKSSIVGYGNATKEQVGAMVTSILGLPRMPRPDDVCDALGIAITAGMKRSFGTRLVTGQDLSYRRGPGK